MKPYNKNFVFQEMKRYSELIGSGTCGTYKITKNIIKNKIYRDICMKTKKNMI